MIFDGPLLLDGDTQGVFANQVPQGDCPQQWMLRNPAHVAGLQNDYVKAGAQLLQAPTSGLHPLGLAEYGLDSEARRLNSSLVALSIQAAEDRVPVAGIISWAGYGWEPLGTLPFADLVDIYAEQAMELLQAGVQGLVLLGMPTAGDARAAVLGARQARLPILVVLEQTEMEPNSLLAALICLQELGISAFGVNVEHTDQAIQALKRLAPYAKVPLAVRLNGELCTPEEIMSAGFSLVAAGARILLGGPGVTPAHIHSLRTMLDNIDLSAHPLQACASPIPILLTDGQRVHYLEEDFASSPPLDCGPDMSKGILEAGDLGVDAICYHIHSLEDAWHFSQSMHLSNMAAMLLADNAEALEMALFYYNGRALVCACSAIDTNTLDILAGGYGAIVR